MKNRPYYDKFRYTIEIELCLIKVLLLFNVL